MRREAISFIEKNYSMFAKYFILLYRNLAVVTSWNATKCFR
jgi:hypothetical protein